MRGEKKIHFGIRKYAVGVVSVALSIGFIVTTSVSVQAEEVSANLVTSQQVGQASTEIEGTARENQVPTETVSQPLSDSSDGAAMVMPLSEQAADEESSTVSAPQAAAEVTSVVSESGETAETPSVPPLIGEDATTTSSQPRSRMARSVADQASIANLPLDAQGQLVTSQAHQTVDQVQEVYADGSSQIVPATADNTPVVANAKQVLEQVRAVSAELKAVTYESLYDGLKNNERFLDNLAIEQELKKEKNGQAPTSEELAARKRQVYMDQLDMRTSFTSVQNRLDTILAGVFEKSTAVNPETVKANKEKILLGLTYLERQYKFALGNFAAKDLILYYPEVFGNQSDLLTNLIQIGSVNYADLELKNNLVTYQKKLAPITNQPNLIAFIESQVPRWTEAPDVESWFNETTRAAIATSISPNGSSSLYQKLKSDSPRLASHILPLLTLSSDSVIVLSTTNTITYGLRDTYVSAAGGTESLTPSMEKAVRGQQAFIDFWYRVSEKGEVLQNHPTVVVVDSLQALGHPHELARNLWSAKTGNKALEGVREFITPLGLYSNFLQAGGQKDSDTRITFFLGKSLTDNGLSVYTHEMTHIFDQKVWFNGFGRRTNKDAELYATGLFDSHNNTQGQSSYLPIFNLNTAYELGTGRTQNQSPTRFETEADLKEYMQGLLDVIYSLDYLEAKVSLEQSAADKAILFNQLAVSPLPSNPVKIRDEFKAIDEHQAASLTTVDDLVDQAIVSGRLAYKGFDTRGFANHNDYFVVPLFEPVFAGLQNDTSFVGDFTTRRYAYELLGEYGYKNGMVAYLSSQYANDKEALAAIMPEHNGNLATFKKAMFARRAARLQDLKATSQFANLADLEIKMRQAVEQDLERMKMNQSSNTFVTTGVTAVRDLKTQIFQEYLTMTNDFRTSIYKEKETSRTFYVTNGPETSTDGAGTEANPYQSLSYALQQASDGDVIKLVQNITHRQDQPFVIDKAVTIDGQGHSLTFRGADVELGDTVTFTKMTLNMIPSGNQQPTIYLNGHQVIFDAVSTTISQQQDSLRPTVVAGSRLGEPTGTHARLLVVNGDSNTRFRQIFAGNAASSSYIPIDIIIDSEFAGVDKGIDLGGPNDQVTYGRVELVTRSNKVKQVSAANSMDNKVTVKAARIYGANFLDIQELSLVENADVTLDNQMTRISSSVELASGSQLQLASDHSVEFGALSGQGKVLIPAGSYLNVLADVSGSVKIVLTGFESQFANNVDQVFLTVEGLLDPTSSVQLSNHYDRFAISQENQTYHLVLQNQPPQLHTVTLEFLHGGQVLKSEQVQVEDGQSVSGVENLLPSSAEGSYQLAQDFDFGLLEAIDSSKLITIPVILVRPMTPILAFDPARIQEVSLVQGLNKSVYQEGESLDLSGLQLRLMDQQGISVVIDASRFAEFGVRTSPVQMPLLTSHHQLEVIVGSQNLSLPIQVQAMPKATRFQPEVSGEVLVWPGDSSQLLEENLLTVLNLPSEAGRVQVIMVDNLPQTSGDYMLTVRVHYDDQSYEDLSLPFHIAKRENGSGVTHELPVGVLPPLETAKGEGVTHELPVGVLPPLETAKGEGVTHELPVGVLPALETAKGEGVTHELPVGVLPPLETAKGEGVTHELPVGVLPPLETAKGEGVTHELPVGVLPPLETAKGEGVTHELPVGVLPPLETAKGEGVTHELPVGVLPVLETAKGEGVTHELPVGVLPVLETAKGEGVTHELPIGVLPPLETAKGEGVTHELPVGVLPGLETAKGEGVTHELPIGVLPVLETAKGDGVTHALPIGVLPPASSNPVAASQKDSSQKEKEASLPETGQTGLLTPLGFFLFLFQFILWKKAKKQEE